MTKKELKHDFKITEEMKLPVEFKIRWIKALRSGNYNQGEGYLYDNKCNDKAYCCLGVACSIQGYSNSYIQSAAFIHKDSFSGLKYNPTKIPKQLTGLADDYDLIDFLSRTNDNSNYCFNDIADWIEEHL